MIAADFRSPRALLVGGIASLAVVFWVGCGGGADSRIEPPPRSNNAEVAIRRHLAEEFLYAEWYPQVGEVDVVGRRASVATTLGPGRRSPSAAREICSAVLSSGAVAKASVEAGAGRVRVCP
jgi:hypothetical protein